jgi:ABC-2 type transport system ATP-binding protein
MIETRCLSIRFGDTPAVDQLDLDIAAGEVFGFLGPNGAGKTTTLRLLLGLLAPDTGSCHVAGLDVRREGQTVRRRCGALLETPGLYEGLSAIENLRYHGGLHGLSGKPLAARIGELLDRFGLSHKGDEPVGRLSLGMKQKLGIARALLHRPQVLFLDEPTRGLDPMATADLRQQLTALANDTGMTLFITSHDLDEIQRLCHRVGLLLSGRLRQVGTVNEVRRRAGSEIVILRSPSFPEAFLCQWQVLNRDGQSASLAVPDDGNLTPLIRSALEHGVPLQEVRRETISLEGAYLRMVENET